MTFNPISKQYEGPGFYIPKSTAANHRLDDSRAQALDSVMDNVAVRVLNGTREPTVQQPEPPIEARTAIEDELSYLEKEVVDQAFHFNPSRPLVFIFEPSAHGPYQHPSAVDHLLRINSGIHALDPENWLNSHFLDNENHLCEILIQLGVAKRSNLRERLEDRVYRELDKLSKCKGAEWSRQRANARGKFIVNTGTESLFQLKSNWNTDSYRRGLLCSRRST